VNTAAIVPRVSVSAWTVSSPSAGATQENHRVLPLPSVGSHGSRVAPSVSTSTVAASASSRSAFAQSSFAGGGGSSVNVQESCVGPPSFQSSRPMC
jgi:hypothetical protein